MPAIAAKVNTGVAASPQITCNIYELLTYPTHLQLEQRGLGYHKLGPSRRLARPLDYVIIVRIDCEPSLVY